MSNGNPETGFGDQPGNGITEADIDLRLADLYPNVDSAEKFTPEVLGALMRDAYRRGREDVLAKKQSEKGSESDQN